MMMIMIFILPLYSQGIQSGKKPALKSGDGDEDDDDGGDDVDYDVDFVDVAASVFTGDSMGKTCIGVW